MYVSNGDLVRIFGKWIKVCLDTGDWDAYFVSFMFKHLPKTPETSIQQIHRELIVFYSKMVVNIVRSPKSPVWADRLPRGLFAPDIFLGYTKMGDIILNDGLHMHGIMNNSFSLALLLPFSD
jgi:hypothetical protein